jgi:hypothetical protein
VSTLEEARAILLEAMEDLKIAHALLLAGNGPAAVRKLATAEAILAEARRTIAAKVAR